MKKLAKQRSMKRERVVSSIILNICMLLLSLIFVLPLCLVVSTSFATDAGLAEFGYTFFPHSFTLDAYKYVFQNPDQILNSYVVTILICLITIPLQLIMNGMTAYALMRASWGYRLLKYIYISCFFGGGMIPVYIWYTQYLHLGNNFLVYIIPCVYSTGNIIMMRTFFKSHPTALIEAAKLDGAGEFYIFLKLIVPISTPLFATLALMSLLSLWNQWTPTMLYIRDEKLWTLGYMLQHILKEAAFQKEMTSQAANITVDIKEAVVPDETIKYAMVVVAAGPAMVIMPFFQKYFKSGLVVGSIKG